MFENISKLFKCICKHHLTWICKIQKRGKLEQFPDHI